MRITIRYYRRFDFDLISILESGVDLTKLLPQVLEGYASRHPVRLFLPTPVSRVWPEEGVFHSAVIITDPASCEVLRGLRKGYRNAFCKALLRQSIIMPSLSGFFESAALADAEDARVQAHDFSGDPDVIVCTPGSQRRRQPSGPVSVPKPEPAAVPSAASSPSGAAASDTSGTGSETQSSGHPEVPANRPDRDVKKADDGIQKAEDTSSGPSADEKKEAVASGSELMDIFKSMMSQN